MPHVLSHAPRGHGPAVQPINDSVNTFIDSCVARSGQVRSGQEQRVAASTFRLYSFVLHLAIAQTDARPVCSRRGDSHWTDVSKE